MEPTPVTRGLGGSVALLPLCSVLLVLQTSSSHIFPGAVSPPGTPDAQQGALSSQPSNWVSSWLLPQASQEPSYQAAPKTRLSVFLGLLAAYDIPQEQPLCPILGPTEE